MALKLNERYPGRFNNPTSGYPQGSFKNRTAPGAQDGSYLEQDWANDVVGFLSSLLVGGGITANGNVDTVGASQYYSGLIAAVKNNLGTAAVRNVGTGTNQLPDMNSFSLSNAVNGYQRLPGGLIIQWGFVSDQSSYAVSFPQAHTSRVMGVIATCDGATNADVNVRASVECQTTSLTSFTLSAWGAAGGVQVPRVRAVHWFSLGV